MLRAPERSALFSFFGWGRGGRIEHGPLSLFLRGERDSIPLACRDLCELPACLLELGLAIERVDRLRHRRDAVQGTPAREVAASGDLREQDVLLAIREREARLQHLGGLGDVDDLASLGRGPELLDDLLEACLGDRRLEHVAGGEPERLVVGAECLIAQDPLVVDATSDVPLVEHARNDHAVDARESEHEAADRERPATRLRVADLDAPADGVADLDLALDPRKERADVEAVVGHRRLVELDLRAQVLELGQELPRDLDVIEPAVRIAEPRASHVARGLLVGADHATNVDVGVQPVVDVLPQELRRIGRHAVEVGLRDLEVGGELTPEVRVERERLEIVTVRVHRQPEPVGAVDVARHLAGVRDQIELARVEVDDPTHQRVECFDGLCHLYLLLGWAVLPGRAVYATALPLRARTSSSTSQNFTRGNERIGAGMMPASTARSNACGYE